MPNHYTRPRSVADTGKLVLPTAHSMRRRIAVLALSFGMATCFGITVCSALPQETATKSIGAILPVPTHDVTIIVDGDTETVDTSKATVGELLEARGIRLGKTDRCTVPLMTPITPDMIPLVITRIRVEQVKERTPLPFVTKKQLTPRLRVGQSKTVRAGVKGEKVTTYRVVTRNGETTRTPIHVSVKQPKSALMLSGMRGATFAHLLASRGSFAGVRSFTMRATGYGPGDNGKWGNQTATGVRPGFGIVAVDPRFMRLGTRLYIENYGYAIAADTGGAIKGNRIDLGYNTHSQAEAVGRRTVRVIVLP